MNRHNQTLGDPACGTGGFLACAIEHVRRRDVRTPRQEAQLQASIRGVEKKPLPYLLCATNMIVHGIDVPAGIVHGNTLSRPLRDLTMRDRVDVVLTNPPFGGMEEDGIENNFPAEFRTRETADLFLILIVELLKPGGRAAVVLPDGTLFGEGVNPIVAETGRSVITRSNREQAPGRLVIPAKAGIQKIFMIEVSSRYPLSRAQASRV